MPLLPWRSDADGFNFDNSWTFDSTEQSTLAGIAGAVAPAAVATAFAAAVGPALALDPLLVFDPTLPTLFTVLMAASSGIAAAVTASASLPGFGMCGGMAFTSLDYWYAKAALPHGGNRNDQPLRPAQAALRNTIWARLIDSLTSGGALQTTIQWSLVLNQLSPKFGGGGGTLLNWTKNEWPKIKAMIDHGQPWPIGLIYTTRDVWDQHQIMVYGYDLLPNGARLYVYDNNNPHAFGESGFDPAKDFLTFDLSGPVLKATSPGDALGGTLAGFFCTNYAPATPPANLATSFGEFITWNGAADFMTAYGAILPVANAAELAALGGAPTDPRQAVAPMPASFPHPRDYALLREHSAAPVFLYQGGAPFWVPDPNQLMKFGGWSAVRVVPDNTIAQFSGSPVNGTLIREVSNGAVFVCNNGTVTPAAVPATDPDVRAVPDGAIVAQLLDKVSLDYSAVLIGGSCQGRVSLKHPFAGADIVVSLSIDQPALAMLSLATVTIAKGNLTSGDFTVSSTGSAPTSGNFSVTITALAGSASVSTRLRFDPPAIAQFTLSPSTVTAGQSTTGTIVLASRCPADLEMNLFSYSSFVSIPTTPILIPKNTIQVSITINTPAVNIPFGTIQAPILASCGSANATAILTVQPSVVAGVVASLSLFPSSVVAGGSSTGTVTLEAAVNVPTVVGLASFDLNGTIFSGPSTLIANMPTQITIDALKTQGQFSITTKAIPPAATHRTAVIMAVAVKQVYAHLVLTT